MNERFNKMTKLTKLILIAPLAILGIVIFTAIGGSLVMLLWNWLAPELFGFRLITFWQALGLLALCRILFGGFGLSGGGARSNSRRRLTERWEQMTPEDREKLLQGLRSRGGGFEAPPA